MSSIDFANALENFIFWPKWIQNSLMIGICCLLMLIGYWFDLQTQLHTVQSLKTSVLQLQKKIEAKKIAQMNRGNKKHGQKTLDTRHAHAGSKLTTYPLHALRMVGRLKQGTHCLGLIALPNGEIHKVTLGDTLGPNHGRVTAINSTIDVTEYLPGGRKRTRQVGGQASLKQP